MANDIKSIQSKMLDIMKMIHNICIENEIDYYIMGGTALGAVRHGGFIPWDDDIDIFMTKSNYVKFKATFEASNPTHLMIQEWGYNNHLEYAKVRMNGTMYIEEAFKDVTEMHHGIFVDIMVLRQCPTVGINKRVYYYISKFITISALINRNWKPHKKWQKFILPFIKLMNQGWVINKAYNYIESFENKPCKHFCYFITRSKYRQGVFLKEIFHPKKLVKFENTFLYAPNDIKKYLEIRYGDYMKLPAEKDIKYYIHAKKADSEIDFKEFFKNE